MRRTIYNDLRALPSLASAARTANAAVNGSAVNVGIGAQNFTVAMLVVLAGTITDGSSAIKVQESADGSTGWTDVPAARLQGANVAVGASDDDKVLEQGVIIDAAKPFLRAVATQSGATSGGTLGALFLLGSPNRTPVVRP